MYLNKEKLSTFWLLTDESVEAFRLLLPGDTEDVDGNAGQHDEKPDPGFRRLLHQREDEEEDDDEEEEYRDGPVETDGPVHFRALPTQVQHTRDRTAHTEPLHEAEVIDQHHHVIRDEHH